jgi:hypothetical protein
MQRKLKNVQVYLQRFDISSGFLADQLGTSVSNVSHALAGKNKTLLNRIAVFLCDNYEIEGSQFFDLSDDEIRARLERFERVQDKIIKTVAGLQQNQSEIINKLK